MRHTLYIYLTMLFVAMLSVVFIIFLSLSGHISELDVIDPEVFTVMRKHI